VKKPILAVLLICAMFLLQGYRWGGYDRGSDDAVNIGTDTTLFGNNLSVLDTDVQAALDTLDDISIGAMLVLDLGDNASNESLDLNKIATTGDTNSVFTEPSADKLLIDLGQNWPTADVANSGDSATAFFSSGTVEAARLPDAEGLNTSLTAGSVVFSDGSNLAQDNTNFFWDDANDVLTLGGVTSVAGVRLLLPMENDAVTPTFAFGDGNTGFYESDDNTIAVATAGLVRFSFLTNRIDSAATGGFGISYVAASATAPTFRPDKMDLDTGLGQAAEDQLSLIAGGIEGIRITESGSVISEYRFFGLDCSGNANGGAITADASGILSCTDDESGGLPVVDTTSIAEGSADATKEVRFEVDGLTTGTVRVLTVPDFDLTIAGTAAPTFTTSITVTGGGVLDADGMDLDTGNDYEINGTAVLDATTLGAAVVNSSLTSVGALASGSIAAGFGAIDNGTSNITSGGLWRIDVDGTAINAVGSLNFGATATDSAIYWNGTNLEIDTTSAIDFSISGTPEVTIDSGGINLITGDAYEINGTSVLNATTLGTAVVASSLTSVGTLTGGDADAVITRPVVLKWQTEAGTQGTGNSATCFTIPIELNGMDLVSVGGHVYTNSSSGTPTYQIRNQTDTADMLSTTLTIDANEPDSSTAATAAVIDGTNDDVVTGDEICVDKDVAGTGEAGDEIRLGFSTP